MWILKNLVEPWLRTTEDLWALRDQEHRVLIDPEILARALAMNDTVLFLVFTKRLVMPTRCAAQLGALGVVVDPAKLEIVDILPAAPEADPEGTAAERFISRWAQVHGLGWMLPEQAGRAAELVFGAVDRHWGVATHKPELTRMLPNKYLGWHHVLGHVGNRRKKADRDVLWAWNLAVLAKPLPGCERLAYFCGHPPADLLPAFKKYCDEGQGAF